MRYTYTTLTYLKSTMEKLSETTSEISSKSIKHTPGRRRSGVFIVNFKQISHILLFASLTLNK